MSICVCTHTSGCVCLYTSASTACVCLCLCLSVSDYIYLCLSVSVCVCLCLPVAMCQPVCLSSGRCQAIFASICIIGLIVDLVTSLSDGGLPDAFNRHSIDRRFDESVTEQLWRTMKIIMCYAIKRLLCASDWIDLDNANETSYRYRGDLEVSRCSLSWWCETVVFRSVLKSHV